ncbi:hypothetical protein LTR74_002233 [Friedmanniomyces endolithicus]|nr:hypothetical protein LTR74_002233 [Friedmanniomyces endolithicus]
MCRLLHGELPHSQRSLLSHAEVIIKGGMAYRVEGTLTEQDQWHEEGKDPADRDPDPASLLYTILPTLIQRHIPRIPSLRRTGSRYTKAPAPSHRRDDSDSSSEGSLTPPPSCHTSARTPLSDPEDTDIDPEEPFHSFPPSRPSTSGSSTPQHLHQSDSGVLWKYAKQGFSLLTLAAQEESLLEQDPVFGRKLYLDSLGYLSRGLPADLSAAEVAGLRVALPESLSGPMGGGEVAARAAEGRVERRRERREVSMLHEAVASITLQLFLVLSFILPYVQLLLQQAYQYDRRHRISDKLVAQSYQLVDHLGKHAMLLATHVGAMNDGQIGVAVRDVGFWWLQGVSGGLYDGFGEGMQTLRRDTEKRTR